MSKPFRDLVLIVLFLAPSSGFGMNPEAGASLLKIQTSDEVEFKIALSIAQQSKMLKNMIEDIREEAEQSISLPKISKKQFELLLPVMQKLAKLPMAELQESEAALAQQLQHIVADLKSDGQPLDNKQLIEFISGANYLNIPLVEPALKELAQRILNKDEWTQLESFGDKLKDLWHVHPAKKLMLEGLSLEHPVLQGFLERGFIEDSDDNNLISWSYRKIKIWDKNNLVESITLKHIGVRDAIESKDGKNLISWSPLVNTIKVWDKNNLPESISLRHPGVTDVIESKDGKNFISWSSEKGTIKIWDKNNLDAKPTTLEHSRVTGVIESLDSDNLISWSFNIHDSIKIWDKNNLDAKPITLEHSYVTGVIGSLDGKNFISWSEIDETIKVWDKNNFAEPITLEHEGVDGVRESGDGIISWSKEEGTIKVWDKNNLAEPITLEHEEVDGVIESGGGIISWGGGIIKIWDKTNLVTKPTITLEHPRVKGVIESKDGNFISWSKKEGTIKVWDKNNLSAEPIALRHPKICGVLESMYGNFISWSWSEGTIKRWNLMLFNPAPEQIHLLLAVYFVNGGYQKFELSDEKLSKLKTTFNTLSPITQTSLEKRAPNFIAAIMSAK